MQLLQSTSSTILFSSSVDITSFGLQSRLRRVYLVLWDLSISHSFSLAPSTYGKYILILISFSWISVDHVCWCGWSKLCLLVILLKILLILLSWYPFSLNTCFTLAFSSVNLSLLVKMEYALLNKGIQNFPWNLFDGENTQIFPLFHFKKVSVSFHYSDHINNLHQNIKFTLKE